MFSKSAGRRDLLDRVIRAHRPAEPQAAQHYNQLIESVRWRSSLLSPRSFRSRSSKKNFCTNDYVGAIAKMARFYQSAVRPAACWNPATPSIQSLSRHLFGRYDVPKFVHLAWFGDVQEIRIMLDMAAGVNARKSIARRKLGMRLTKKASHFFSNAPDRFGIRDTIRWAQARALGGSDHLSSRIVKACSGFQYDEQFWHSLLSFLVAACQLKTGKKERSVVMPDDHELFEIAQFVWQQKYVDASQILGYRVLHDIPLQPEFSFRGRTLKSMRRHMRNWRSEITLPVSTAIDISKRNWVWPPSGLQPLVVQQNGSEWEFVEILDSFQLRAEGGLMHHCVAIYESSCRSGRCSIWSLRKNIGQTTRRVVTIEVWPENSKIMQTKAKKNAQPTSQALALISHWAQHNALQVN